MGIDGKTGCGLWPFLLVAALSLWGCKERQDASQLAAQISSRYGLEVKAGDPSTFYPKGFSQDSASLPGVAMAPTSLAEAGDTLSGIADALAIYPPEFVNGLVDAIYVSGPMTIDGAPAGGTFGPRWIVLTSIERWNGTNANYDNALRGVHHELSSLVLARVPMLAEQWQRLMPPDWQAVSSSGEALLVDGSAPPPLAQGFLSAYAATSVGNDFNTYAEFAFAEPQQLIEWARQYPLIARKLGLLIAAYGGRAAELNGYFASSGLSAVAVVADQPTTVNLSLDVSDVQPQLLP